MVAFEARVVGENFVRRQAIRSAAEGARATREHYGREADAVGLEFAAQLGPVLFGGDEDAPAGDQRAHFFHHAGAEVGVARAEGHDHDLRAFAEQAKDPLLHRVDLEYQSTAHAARGVKATATITGV